MTKLYEVSACNSINWCFAPDSKTAKQIVLSEIYQNQKRNLKAIDKTTEKYNEDGVKYLSDNNFIGIPQKSYFMLNCCTKTQNEHYNQKSRSEVLWWSEKLPESKDIWNANG